MATHTAARPLTARRSAATKALGVLLTLEGVAAVGGGAVMIADPAGGLLQWSTEMLAATPFDSFLWPGLLLGCGLGLSALVVALGVWRRPVWRWAAPVERLTGQHWSWSGSIALGLALVVWIGVQLLLTDVRSFLQPTMALVGIALATLPLLHVTRDDLPAPGPR